MPPFGRSVRAAATSEVAAGTSAAASTRRGSVDIRISSETEHVHVVVFDDLAGQPRSVVRELFAFLEVDGEVADQVDIAVHNRSGSPRNRLIGTVLGSTRLRRLGNRAVPYAIRTPFEQRLLDHRSSPAEPGPQLREALDDELAADRQDLEALLGRSLPWD